MAIVNVILPTYNHAHFLPYAVQSVLKQDLQDFEVVIVDDGSTDNTPEVVRQYSDPRIRYIRQSNRGLAATRNTGIRASEGKYLAFLDADDLFLPCKLQAQVDWLEEHAGYGFVAGAWNYVDETGKVIGEYRPGNDAPELSVRKWLYDCRVNPISVLVSRAWIERVGGFDEHLRQVEDWDMWLRLAYAGCRMGWVNATVCSYRFSPGQMTRNAAVQKQSSIQMMDKFYGQPGLPEELSAIKDQIYSHLYLISAGREYGVGQITDAQDSVSMAIKYNPSLAINWEDEQVNNLLSWEDGPRFAGSTINYRTLVFNNLPDSAKALLRRRRWALGEAGLKTFYSAYRSRDWRLVRRSARVVMRNAPHCMLNRGFWSILSRSLWQVVSL